MSDYEKVGQVYVDGGYLIVADPFSLPAKENSQEIYERLDELDNECGLYAPGITAVKTGLGDGIYEVEVRYEELPGWGKRVAEMRIVFLTDEMKEIGRKILDGAATT